MISILLVDDEPGILSVCQRILETEKYTIYTAKNGEEACDFLKNALVDIVLLDIRMPRMDGVELLRKIKSSYPSIEVLIVTADTHIEIAIECLKNGAFDYILKPFNVTEILSSVKRAAEYIQLHTKETLFKDIASLYQVYHEVEKNSEKGHLLNLILERAVRALNADSGSILTVNPRKQSLKLMATFGNEFDNTGEIKMGERISGWVAKNRHPLIIQDGFQNTPQFDDLPVRKEIVSSLVAPLIRHDKTIGVLCLNRLKDKNDTLFSQHELESFQIFARHASIMLSLNTEDFPQKPGLSRVH